MGSRIEREKKKSSRSRMTEGCKKTGTEKRGSWDTHILEG